MHKQKAKMKGLIEISGIDTSFLKIKIVIKMILNKEKYCSIVKYKNMFNDKNIN